MNDKKEEKKAAGVIDFHIPSMSQGIPMVVLAAVVVTTAIFLLIPFTQLLESIGKKDSLIVQVDIAPPPPPPPYEGVSKKLKLTQKKLKSTQKTQLHLL